MARIAGVDIPRDKRVVISLTYIYGIGNTTAKQILANAGVSEDVRVRDLTNEQTDAIRAEVDKLIAYSFIHPTIKKRPSNQQVKITKSSKKAWITPSLTA